MGINRQSIIQLTADSDLGEYIDGLQDSDLLVFLAKTDVEKSNLVLNAMDSPVGMNSIGLVSLERTREEWGFLLLSNRSTISLDKITAGEIESSDWPKLVKASHELSDAQIYIDDLDKMGTLEIKAKAKKMKAEKNIGMLIIDYMKLIRERNKDMPEQEIKVFKEMAMELKVPVIVI